MQANTITGVARGQRREATGAGGGTADWSRMAVRLSIQTWQKEYTNGHCFSTYWGMETLSSWREVVRWHPCPLVFRDGPVGMFDYIYKGVRL